MANGTPTWNGTDSCSSKTDLGNLGSSVGAAWNQFLDYISIPANQNTDVSTLKWYVTGGNYLTTPGNQNIPNSIACPVLNDLPNFYQYHFRFFIANAGLGWHYTWTELLDTVNNANVITTSLTSSMVWQDVQDILFNEGDIDWHIVSQQERCSCVGSISGGGGGGAVTGCMNPTATNYNPLATVDDGSCIGGLTPGCCDPTATNFDPLATCDDGSCLYTGGNTCLTCGTTGSDDSVPGCCNSTAFNYNPAATCDDGSCIPIIYGCLDLTAINYYASANIDDGSCVYPLATYDCINNACIDPGTGNGAYASLSACNTACSIVVTPSWDCDGQGNCSDPGTGNGTYASLVACQSNCITPPPPINCHQNYHLFERCSDGFSMSFGNYGPAGTGGTTYRFACDVSHEHFDFINNNIGTLSIGDVLSLDVTNGNISGPSHFTNQEACYKYMGIGSNPGNGSKMLYHKPSINSFSWTIHQACAICSNFV
tara:strand:+ start:597 stop:2045 length:1449 start_codon:yes stop_codon:yes gene_type:complete